MPGQYYVIRSLIYTYNSIKRSISTLIQKVLQAGKELRDFETLTAFRLRFDETVV